MRGLASFLRITHHLPGYLHCPGRWAPFLYRERLGALLDHCLARLFLQDRVFFLPRPANDSFHVIDVQHDPAIPISVLLSPHVSSPCLDANEEIDLRATGSPGYWSMQLF